MYDNPLAQYLSKLTFSKTTPISYTDVPKYALYGNKAMKRVEKDLGRELSPLERRIVEVEGFVPVPYYDSKGVLTYGVGQTGDYIKKGFVPTLVDHVERTRKLVNNFDQLPENLQIELVQGTYRGDIPKSPKFLKLLNAGKYAEAADEFLDHREYKKYMEARKGGNPKAGGNIPERLEAIRDAVLALEQERPSSVPEKKTKPDDFFNLLKKLTGETSV